MNSNIRERLVAHRGDHETTPENTLVSFERAVAAGARWIECDIQFTRDHEPVVLHDEHLGRLCGVDRNIASYNYDELFELSVSVPKRDGGPFEGESIMFLSDFLLWLRDKPDVSLFMEIKAEALSRLSPEEIVKIILPMIKDSAQVVPISTSAEILEILHVQYARPLGWVVEGPQPKVGLEYVFVDFCDEETVWKWHDKGAMVAVYTFNEADEARLCWAEGADLVETNHFTRLYHELRG